MAIGVLFAARNARSGLGEGRHHIAGDFIVPTVVAALHDYDVVAPGVGAREAERKVGGLTAGGGELDLFN